jgi:hypothetical protein
LNILLVNGNTTRCGRGVFTPTPGPAGLISLAGVLRRRGHRVQIRQVSEHVLPQDNESLPLARAELESILAEFSPDLIGISCRNIGAARQPANPFHLVQYYSVYYDERLVRLFHQLSRAPVVMGGSAFSIEPGLYLKYARPDFGLIGEAEESLAALAEALQRHETPRGIPGLVAGLADLDSARQNVGRVADLSAIGPGACDVVHDFPRHYYESGGYGQIQTKRGCPMNCIYCTTPWLEGRTYRYRPIEYAVEEMRAYRDVWGVRHFFFVDGTFNHPVDHALEVCEALLQANLGVEWYACVNPAAVPDELARAMKRAGCMGVTLTPDSCSDRVLKAYDKGFSTAEVAQAVGALQRHNIPIDTCIIIGGPGETRETVAESVTFCEEHLPGDVVRFYNGLVITNSCPAHGLGVSEGLIDPKRPYEDLVLGNDFRAARRYEYLFPHVKEDRRELLKWVAQVCRRRRWLTSEDIVASRGTGEFHLRPEIHTEPGARPWWSGLERNAGAGQAAGCSAKTAPDTVSR